MCKTVGARKAAYGPWLVSQCSVDCSCSLHCNCCLSDIVHRSGPAAFQCCFFYNWYIWKIFIMNLQLILSDHLAMCQRMALTSRGSNNYWSLMDYNDYKVTVMTIMVCLGMSCCHMSHTHWVDENHRWETFGFSVQKLRCPVQRHLKMDRHVEAHT